MPTPVLAAAQCAIKAGDIDANLAVHLSFMRHAADHGVGLLMFPELSLCGYEPTLAEALAQDLDTPVLAPLQALAREASMTTIVGLPLRLAGAGKPLIGAFILHPDGSLDVYTKQHLHGGEEQYFSPGHGGALLPVAGLPVALSVCADFTRPEHAASAAQRGARVYATSVLIGEGGYPHDSSLLQGHAQRHGMAVLMANHGGPTGGWAAAGRSAFWDEQGECVAATSGPGDRLLVVRKHAQQWLGVDCPVRVC
ncbi:carbon-nitrogen hydrolase family protein [Pseudomonas sp. RIT-PI-S]|uniref:carbon-nitrogen hydrolase family protein n=1 Tax=Pseudomonas sp. RIT-PI-S TaxID=3035295 RepID=UPI0021DAFB95|nr:carbon-nitrogen hydrolase family protein [Pseudomonas sp. RIT-PI-S]